MKYHKNIAKFVSIIVFFSALLIITGCNNSTPDDVIEIVEIEDIEPPAELLEENYPVFFQGSFEDFEDMDISSYKSDASEGASVSLSLVNDNVISGSNALKIEYTASDSSSWGYVFSRPILLRDWSQASQFSFFVKGLKSNTNYQLLLGDEDGDRFTGPLSIYPQGDWSFVVGNVDDFNTIIESNGNGILDKNQLVSFFVKLNGENNQILYLDNFQISDRPYFSLDSFSRDASAYVATSSDSANINLQSLNSMDEFNNVLRINYNANNGDNWGYVFSPALSYSDWTSNSKLTFYMKDLPKSVTLQFLISDSDGDRFTGSYVTSDLDSGWTFVSADMNEFNFLVEKHGDGQLDRSSILAYMIRLESKTQVDASVYVADLGIY